MFPGTHPLEELEATLVRIATRPIPTLRTTLEAGSRGLVDSADALLPRDVVLVLVVDQMEELYTTSSDVHERNAFLELLRVACAEPDSRISVMVTLRADFYDRPLQLARFGELLAEQTWAVPPMTADELELAIRGPADRVGVTPEPGLVAELVADVAHQPGSLPFLQFALAELFESRRGSAMTSAAYRSIGGIGGAVSARAERIFAESTPEEQHAIRQVFLRLVTVGERREDTRRRVVRRELDNLEIQSSTLDQAIARFGNHRILTFDHEPLTREPTVEIAHEALIAAWDRLRDWIDGARDDLRTERRLSRAATEWRVAEEDPSYLLRGGRLESVETWIDGTDLAVGRDELLFVNASVGLRDRERRAETANRFVHLEWSMPTEVFTESSVTGRWPSLPVPAASEAFEQHLTRQQVLVSGFLRARPHLLSSIPADAVARGRAFPTPRTWDFVARLLACCKDAALGTAVEDLLVAGAVGAATGHEVMTWMRLQDLPDPEVLLADPHAYDFAGMRVDRVFMALQGVLAAVVETPTPERWNAAVVVCARAADEVGVDPAVPVIRALVSRDIRPNGAIVPPEISTFAGTLALAGLLPGAA